MILVDTSVWIDHIRVPVMTLDKLLNQDDVAIHPFVLGEIAMGSQKNRDEVLLSLKQIPQLNLLFDEEVLDFVKRHSLFGLGISYIDAHLLASVMLEDEALLWTRDKRLHDAAHRLGLAMIETGPFLN